MNKNLLFLGTEMGLFATLDGGNNWFRMKNNIPEYALVRDIQIHPSENALIIGTHGRGVYIFDDISTLRTMNREVADKELHLFEISDMVISDGKYGGGNPFSGGWNAPNPEELVPIQYYLKDRLMNGDVKIEIYDQDKKLVQSIPGGKRKGINKVFWNYRMKPPKVAEGGTKLDYGAFFAPQVLPGNYTIKLKVGDKELEDNILLRHLDEKNYTFEDRKLQYETSMKYFKMHEDLAKTVDDINKEQKLIVETKEKLKSKKSKEAASQYFDQLENLRSTLLATKQKSIFADETKLREEITEAYSAVVQSQQRPSNLSIERISVLQKRVDQAKTTYQDIRDKQGSKFLKHLKEEGIILPLKS
jgi:hypothetical protein